MKKSLIIFSLTLGIVFFLYKIYTSQPEYLAANYMRVPDFFSLPSSEFNYSNPTVCLDELHSQGRKFEDFGSAFYMLHISEKHPNFKGNFVGLQKCCKDRFFFYYNQTSRKYIRHI